MDFLKSLTKRELQVLNLFRLGKMNKVVSHELCISMRTVEAHKSKIFKKLGVRSVVEISEREIFELKLQLNESNDELFRLSRKISWG